MPEVSSNKIEFLKEGINYLFMLPLIELTSRTGIAFNKPLSAGLLINTDCNLNCPFCFIEKNTRDYKKLTEQEIYGMIDELAEWGVMQFTVSGGEPLLDPLIFKVLSYAKSRGMITGFTTNGTLLNSRNIEEIRKAKVDRVSISIDGPEEHHDRLRGKGVYGKVIKNLELIKKLAPEIKLRINTVVFDHNIDHLVEMFEFSRKYGAQFNIMPFTFEMMTLIKQRPLKVDEVKRLMVKKESLERLDSTLDELKMLKRKHGVLIAPDHFIDLMKQYYRHPEYVDRTCKKGAYHLAVSSDGTVGFCGYIGSIGNIRDTPLRELWSSKEFVKARRRMYGCKKCMLNCNYTPPLLDLVKDFLVYPMGRALHMC